MELLILLAVILTIVAIAKILRSRELVDSFKNVESDPISAEEVKTNALGMVVWGVVFFSLVILMVVSWDKYLLPSSASVHGEEIDTLLAVTMYLIFGVFFITHILLFTFVYKYYYRADRKAFWFPHDNKLEMAWTIVPAAVLILLITYGMSTWSATMYQDVKADAVRMEIVSEQFKWTTRYAGDDKVLGEASFALYGKNSLGIATKAAMEERKMECLKTIYGENTTYSEEKKRYVWNQEDKCLVNDSTELEKLIAADWNRGDKLAEVEQSLKNYKANVRRLNKMLADYDADPSKYDAGNDDLVINSDSIYLPKGKQVVLQLRSKDVIHSAYMPHFRVQMNTVPGMKTSFTFEPKYTDEEMLEVATSEGKKFTGYILLCNKICGASHFNMKLFVKVVEPEVFDKWIAGQKKFAETL